MTAATLPRSTALVDAGRDWGKPLSADDARVLTAQMNAATRSFMTVGALLKQAHRGGAWATLGYETFEEYCLTEFGPRGLRLAERHRVVAAVKGSSADTRSVYFIQAATGGLVKIGVAGDPVARLAEIQRMCPIPLRILGTLPGVGQAGESALHRRFAAERRHGEWFELTAEQLREVSA